MVAIGGKADIASGCSNRPHWHLADILVALNNVRFWGQRGHQRPAIRCPLLTQSGHRPIPIFAPFLGKTFGLWVTLTDW